MSTLHRGGWLTRARAGARTARSIVILIVFAAALLRFADAAFAQPLFSPTQDPIAGSRIFGAKGCAKCHAVNGVGAKVGPDLGRVSSARSFYDLAAAMWNHLPQMAQQMEKLGIRRPELSPAETGDLIAFLYTLNYFERPGNPQTGQQIFLAKRCVACHQVAGTGGVVGPNLDGVAQLSSPIYVAAAMWDHGPAMTEAMRARGIQRPDFSGVELADLVAYVKSTATAQAVQIYLLPGRPDAGRALFVQRRCIECHSVKGRGGKIGGDLAERRVQLGLLQFAAAMWNKAPSMIEEMKQKNVPVPQLSAEEMSDIVAYLYAVQYFVRAGDARRGETLASAKACLACHAIDGKGGRVGPDLTKLARLDQPATIVSGMWNHATTMEKKMAEMSVKWPLLKGGELADLVAFIQTREHR